MNYFTEHPYHNGPLCLYEMDLKLNHESNTLQLVTSGKLIIFPNPYMHENEMRQCM